MDAASVQHATLRQGGEAVIGGHQVRVLAIEAATKDHPVGIVLEVLRRG